VDERETPHETDLLESVAPAIGPAIMMSAAGECLYSALDAAGITDVDRGNFKPERRRGRLDDRELSDPLWNCRITQHGRSRGARRNLLEQLQPFRASAVFQLGKSCGVPLAAKGLRQIRPRPDRRLREAQFGSSAGAAPRTSRLLMPAIALLRLCATAST
jgi:hypothetical protein